MKCSDKKWSNIQLGKPLRIFSGRSVSSVTFRASCQRLPSVLFKLASKSVHQPMISLMSEGGFGIRKGIINSNFAFNFIFSLLKFHWQKSMGFFLCVFDGQRINLIQFLNLVEQRQPPAPFLCLIFNESMSNK